MSALRRLGALALKEIIEHALVLTFVFALLSLGWLLFLLAAFGSPTTVTYLEAHGNFTRFALPMAAMALGNRLVVSELSGRTQRFLESLPMRPGEPLLVKWLFGLSVLEGFGLTSLLATALVASLREPMDPLFLFLLTVRTAIGLGTLWSFFFSMGLFGKLRVPLYLLLGLGLAVISSTTSLEVMHFGPFGLLGQDFTLERSEFPTLEVLECLGLSVFFLLAGGIVATLGEGSVEERLSKPMSQRELAFAGIATFALLVIWGELSPEPQPAPYVMAADHVLHAEHLPIAVGYVDEDAREDAETLLGRLTSDVGSLASLAGWERLPQVRVVLRRSLDGRIVEPVGLGRDDGVLLRANFLRSAEPDLTGISAQALAALLDARTRGRSALPPRRWLRDGLALHWAARSEAATRSEAGPAVGLDDARIAHALFVAREVPTDGSLAARYLVLRERHGDAGIAAYAATGVQSLVAHDPSGARLGELLRRAFPSGAHEDFRAVLTEWLDPLPTQIEATMGVNERALFEGWAGELDRLATLPAPRVLLDGLGAVRATLTVEGTDLVVRAETGPGEGRVLTVRHFDLGPFDREVLDHEMLSESTVAGTEAWDIASAEIRIAGRYDHGSRVLVTADLSGTPIGAPLRLLAERIEIP